VGIPLGRDKTNLASLSNSIKWTTNPVKVLGVYVGGSKEEREKLNWDSRIISLEKQLNTWHQRDLTLFGKITIIKSLALPKLTYCASIIDVPKYVIQQTEKLFFKFLWKSNDRIRRKRIINTIELGGLNMVDIESHIEALRAVWVNRIQDASADAGWAILPRYYFGKVSQDLVTQFNFVSGTLCVLDSIPPFYRDTILAFSKAKKPNVVQCKQDLLNQIIWGNHLFSLSKCKTKKLLYFKEWVKSGIIRLGDCVFVNGSLDLSAMFNKIKNKCNIFSECTQLLQALRPYKGLLRNEQGYNTIDNNEHVYPVIKVHSSTFFYAYLVEKKRENGTVSNVWKELRNVQNETNLESAYVHKVKLIWEKKLAEFNYKVLYNILACPTNLKKWKISQNDTCEICNSVCDVIHLLIKCNIAEFAWSVAERILDSKLEVADIIVGSRFDSIKNHFITLISFLIYKYWILSNNNKLKRSLPGFKLFLLKECKLRIEIYKCMKKYELVNVLMKCIIHLK